MAPRTAGQDHTNECPDLFEDRGVGDQRPPSHHSKTVLSTVSVGWTEPALQTAQPHLEDGSAYRPMRVGRLASCILGRVRTSVKIPPLEEDRTAHKHRGVKDHTSPNHIAKRKFLPSLRSDIHDTGIASPRCVDRLPSHISKMVVSTVSGGGPECTVLSLSQKSPLPCLRQNGATTGATISESTATYDYQRRS